MTNCINCGAILHGDKCEYCGTEYHNRGIRARFDQNDFMGTINIGDDEMSVYISSMEARLIGGGSYRDAEGNLCRENAKMKRTFTVVEI